MPKDPIPTDCETVEAVAHALAATRRDNLTATGLAVVDEATFVRGAVVLYLGDAAPPETPLSPYEGIQNRWQQIKSRIHSRAERLSVELGYGT